MFFVIVFDLINLCNRLDGIWFGLWTTVVSGEIFPVDFPAAEFRKLTKYTNININSDIRYTSKTGIMKISTWNISEK